MIAEVLTTHREELYEEDVCICGHHGDWTMHVTEAVAAAGLAVVKLPELHYGFPWPKSAYWGVHSEKTGVVAAVARDSILPVDEARAFAAALLAAANAATATTP